MPIAFRNYQNIDFQMILKTSRSIQNNEDNFYFQFESPKHEYIKEKQNLKS